MGEKTKPKQSRKDKHNHCTNNTHLVNIQTDQRYNRTRIRLPFAVVIAVVVIALAIRHDASIATRQLLGQLTEESANELLSIAIWVRTG